MRLQSRLTALIRVAATERGRPPSGDGSYDTVFIFGEAISPYLNNSFNPVTQYADSHHWQCGANVAISGKSSSPSPRIKRQMPGMWPKETHDRPRHHLQGFGFIRPDYRSSSYKYADADKKASDSASKSSDSGFQQERQWFLEEFVLEGLITERATRNSATEESG